MSSDLRYLFIPYVMQALGFRGFHVVAVLVRFVTWNHVASNVKSCFYGVLDRL